MAPNSESEVIKPRQKLNTFTRFTKTFSLSRQLKKRREGKLLETFAGHEGGINCLAISVDESILITGSEDTTARVWALSELEGLDNDDKCLGVLEGHTSYITCVAILDCYVFTGSADGDIRKWDLSTCECVYVYKGHDSKVHKLLVTDSFVFSSSHDKTAKVWYADVDDKPKSCIRTLKGHGHAVYPMVFLPCMSEEAEAEAAAAEEADNEEYFHQEDLLITGSADTNIKFWSLYSGECLATLHNHTGSVVALATDPQGQILYSCGADRFIKYWDIQTRKQLKSIEAHRTPIVCMHINHRLMYTGSQDGTAKCWVTEFGDNTVIYKGHTMSVTVVKFHKGLVITGCGDGVIRCFDAKSGYLLRTYAGSSAGNDGGAVISLHIARDKIYSTSVDAVVRVFSIDWKFIRVYMAVLSGDVESILGEEEELLRDEPNSAVFLGTEEVGGNSRRPSNASAVMMASPTRSVRQEDTLVEEVNEEGEQEGGGEEEEGEIAAAEEEEVQGEEAEGGEEAAAAADEEEAAAEQEGDGEVDDALALFD